MTRCARAREAIERAAAASEEEALRRLGDERLRIARDVHDVVAHAMVAINVQAGVAAHLIDRDPEQARSALREIKASSGEALADLRATLGVLRDPDAAAPVAPDRDSTIWPPGCAPPACGWRSRPSRSTARCRAPSTGSCRRR